MISTSPGWCSSTRSRSSVTWPMAEVDFRAPARRRGLARRHGPIAGVVALGGGFGSVARYGLAEAWPTRPDAFPWATFTVNVLGCLLIGVLMVLITEVWSAHRLARPLLGGWGLGGVTTFSTY